MHPGYIQVASGSIFMKIVQNGRTRSAMSAQLSVAYCNYLLL